MQRHLVFPLLALAAGCATGQTPARPDPADAKALVPARTYESAFKNYRSYAEAEAEAEPGRWREANEEMGRLNGHVGHVPGSGPPSGSRGAGAERAPKPPPAHGGHK